MCDIIWCKDCDTVNYLDPYYFWNWEGKIKCAGCENVYYIYMIQGHMYKGPDKKPGGKGGHPARLCRQANQGYDRFFPAPRARPGPTTVCPAISTWEGRTW